jgi:acyl-CoA synthetase (NDP forming)
MTATQAVRPELASMFAPRSIALVGVSERSLWSNLVLDGLDLMGFDGRLELVNPLWSEVRGRPVRASLAEMAAERGPVDVAFVLTAASQVSAVLDDAATAGIADIIVLASGFSETGPEGAAAERGLAERARDAGLRVLGPNALGYVNPVARVGLFPPLPRHPPPHPGPVAIVSQSGGVAAELLDVLAAADLGASLLVGVGNEACIDVADVIGYLADDPATRVICLFLETVRNPDKFLAAAGRARACGTLVVAIKVGRSSAAARSVAAHTGGIAGDDRAVSAALRSAGILRVDTPEELLTTAGVALALSGGRGGALAGGRGGALAGGCGGALAAIAISGGACALIADAADRHGLELAGLSDATTRPIAEAIAAFGQVTNPLDVTGAVISRPEILETVLRALRGDPAVHTVLCQMPLAEHRTVASDALLEVLARASKPHPGRADVLIASGNEVSLSASARECLREFGLPFAWGNAEHVVAAVARLGTRRSAPPRPAGLGTPVAVPARPRRGTWSEADGRLLLMENGVPVVPGTVVRDAESAARAGALYGEAAVKAVSSSLVHKSDTGAVRLGVLGTGQMRASFHAVSAAAGQREPAVLITPMRRGGIELLVGVVRDVQWGLLLAVGLGGIWAEILDDASVRRLPVDRAEAARMLDELRGRRLLDGYRAGPPADLDAVAAVICRVGALAAGIGDELESLEINPLYVRGAEVEALDVTVSWTRR